MMILQINDARAWIDRFIAAVELHHQELTELDRLTGDGDYGTNVRSALRAASLALRTSSETVAEIFTAVSDGFLSTGGTSGPLFGMWFREFAKAAGEGLSTPQLAVAATEAVAVVQRLGHAEIGHKTMVDAMSPAAHALTVAAEEGADLWLSLARAALAARAGAESTRSLKARRGRASYVGERAVGVEDPGAVTVALFFEASLVPEAMTPGV